jgi:hypothetical protein
MDFSSPSCHLVALMSIGPNILVSTLFPHALNLCSSLDVRDGVSDIEGI